MSTTQPSSSFAHGAGTIFRLQWKRLRRSKKLRLGIVSLLLVLFAVVLARYSAPTAKPAEVVQVGLRWGFFTLLVYLFPFLFASGAIAEEVESRTFTYLVARPVSRAAICVGKYLAASSAAVTLVVAGALALHLAAFATEPSLLVEQLPTALRTAGALALLSLCYGAISMFWGALVPDAAGVIAILHLGTLELCGSWLPGMFRLVSMNYLAQQLAGAPKAGLLPSTAPDVPAVAACLALILVTALFLGLAAITAQTSEYRLGRA